MTEAELNEAIFPQQATPQPRKPAKTATCPDCYYGRDAYIYEMTGREEPCQRCDGTGYVEPEADPATEPEPEPQRRIDFGAYSEWSRFFVRPTTPEPIAEQPTPEPPQLTSLQHAQAQALLLSMAHADMPADLDMCMRLVELHTALAQAEALTRLAEAMEGK